MNRTIIVVSTVAATLVLAERTSFAADPTTADCLAASDASLRLGNEHKLRAERAQLLVCAAPSCPEDIRKECLSHVDEVNAEIPTVIFAAKDAAGADLSAVKVMMDGEVLAERLEGSALSIDPGTHTFTFERAGQASVTKEFTIQQAQKDRRELITFAVPGAATATALQPSPAAPSPMETGQGGQRDQGLGTRRILAIVAGGVGVVGLGVGTAFGVVAMSKKSTAQGICPMTMCATAVGVSDWNSASSAGTLSTVGFVIGGVGIAGAAVLWFTAPKSSPRAPSTQVGFGPGSFQLKGTW
jgi:hypothetical protein